MNKQGEKGIGWCDMTWNPISGCLHDCKYCYARKIATRFGGNEVDEMIEINPRLHILEAKRETPYPFNFEPTFHTYRLDEPARKTKPRKIFVCSMADLFGDWVPDTWIEQVFEACLEAPQHTYLFLTKNPKRYVELREKNLLPLSLNAFYGATATNKDSIYAARDVFYDLEYITNNLFYSIEPLTEDVSDEMKYSYYRGQPFDWCQWVIVGAETGNRKGKIVPKREWIESIVKECRSVDVPVFMKDNLKSVWGEDLIKEYPDSMRGDTK